MADTSQSKKLKNLEEQLKELDKRVQFFKSIQDSASHAIISTDREGLILSFNKKAEELLGYKAEELVGKKTPAIFHDPDEIFARAEEFSVKLGKKIEPGFETFVCHSDEGLVNEFEWTYVHREETKFPVLLSITAMKDELNRTVGYLGLARDIRHEKRIESELKNKNEDLELAQELAKLGSWSFDIASSKINWSKQMYSIFPENIEDGEPDFEKHKSTIHPDDVAMWEEVVGKCSQDGEPYKMLFRTYKKDCPEEVVWVEARGKGTIEDGRIVSLSGTCQDVTENIIKEQKLKKAEKEAKKAEKAKSAFLANMSHEIRTPMNGIIGMIQLLKETTLDDQQKDMMETISLSSHTLLNLVSDILDISKIDAGKLKISESNFNLYKCISSISDLMANKASEHGTLLELKLPDIKENRKWFFGDEIRVRQIMTNYVSNAVKFTENGKITIGWDTLEVNKKSSKIKFFVSDNGVGIPKEDQAKLFQSFVQADATITRKYGGTGLGLAICSKLAKLLKGSVSFKSEVGKGSTFYFDVELKHGEEEQLDDAQLEGEGQLAEKFPYRIILAEDNKINQKVAIMTLKKLGYECDVANNGLEVLNILSKKPVGHYDLILMDMQMPEMDGITATQKINELYPENAPTIIALTANAFITDKERCIEAGMVDFLSKPLSKKDLILMLLKYFKN